MGRAGTAPYSRAAHPMRGATMAGRSDFTDEEWTTLQKGITGGGVLVSVGHKDFTDSFGEASAMAKELVEQRKEGATEFLREPARTRGTGFGLVASAGEAEEVIGRAHV